MSSVVKTVFGGSDDSAQEAQIEANERSAQLIARQAQVAKGEVNRLFPQADAARNRGLGLAAEVLAGATPEQLRLSDQGNLQAQRALLSGLPQVQNAILGQPVDLSGLQPQAISPDLSFLSAGLSGLQGATGFGPAGQGAQGAPVQPGSFNNFLNRPSGTTGGVNLSRLLGGGVGPNFRRIL